jgi:hypothetical protein
VIDVQGRLESVEHALVDGDAELTTELGDHHELTRARVWGGRVLVDWEPDSMAGGSLLRPDLLRRLVALHAAVEDLPRDATLRLVASGRIVAGLTREHAELVSRLGGARRVEMRTDLRFEGEKYLGGQETYYLIERGQRLPLLRIRAVVSSRVNRVDKASPRTSPSRL